MMAPRSVALGLLLLSGLSCSRPLRGPPGRGTRSIIRPRQRGSPAPLEARAALFQRSAYRTSHGVDTARFLEEAPSAVGKRRKVVWVTGYPRSGSSTLLSMVSVTGVGDKARDAFALFEPCHDGDMVDRELRSLGCPGLLRELSQCRFDHVKTLWGWKDPHSTGNGAKFTPELAASSCTKANRVTFKTVDYGHNLSKWVDFLEENPDMHIVAAVRDPRGIWASWKSMEPFAALVREGNFYSLEAVCKSFAANIEVDHPRITQVLFDKMVKHPGEVTRQVYASVGMDFGSAQRAWVRRNFNNKECPPPPEWQVGYDDCREDSESVAAQWRDVLTEEDLRRFNEDENCQTVKRHYALGD